MLNEPFPLGPSSVKSSSPSPGSSLTCLSTDTSDTLALRGDEGVVKRRREKVGAAKVDRRLAVRGNARSNDRVGFMMEYAYVLVTCCRYCCDTVMINV